MGELADRKWRQIQRRIVLIVVAVLVGCASAFTYEVMIQMGSANLSDIVIIVIVFPRPAFPLWAFMSFWHKAIERAEGRPISWPSSLRVREGDHRETLVAHF